MQISSADLSSYRGKYDGQTVFVLGTGPSIAQEDLSLLRDRPVMTVNGATLLQEKYDFVPDFFCTSDARFLSSDKKDLAADRLHPDTKRLVRDVIRPYDDPAFADRTFYINTIGKNGFSKQIDRGFYFWCTSISLPIQMAWYMGARTVALLGVDLTYAKSQPRFYEEDSPQPVDPFVGVQIRNIVDAARAFEQDRRELVVCSEESLLRPYLTYRSFEEAVNFK
jgi:hypothetical protein